MKNSPSFIWRSYMLRRNRRRLRSWLILLVFHQFFTIPLLPASFLDPISEISDAYMDILNSKEDLGRYWDEDSGIVPDDLKPRYRKKLVLTTSSEYDGQRSKFHGMILAERQPRRRTLIPFPFGAWGVYGVPPRGNWNSGIVRIRSDLESRRFCAFVAEQEGGGFNFAASFIPDVLIYVFWLAVACVYVRRQRRKRREETAMTERFKEFCDALLEYREQKGRFPTNIKELGETVAPERLKIFHQHEFRCLSTLNVGAIAAPPKPWRAPFAPWGFGKRTLVAFEDGSIVKVRGRRAVELFYDVLWAAEKWKDVGRFYPVKNKLALEEGELRFKRIARVDRILKSAIFLILCLFFLSLFMTRYFSGPYSLRYFWSDLVLAVILGTFLFLGIIPLPIGSFYEFMAHTVFGWI